MAIMTHAKFHFNWLMLTLIFGIWASEPPLGPGERLKRPGLIGLKWILMQDFSIILGPILGVPIEEKSFANFENFFYFG